MTQNRSLASLTLFRYIVPHISAKELNRNRKLALTNVDFCKEVLERILSTPEPEFYNTLIPFLATVPSSTFVSAIKRLGLDSISKKLDLSNITGQFCYLLLNAKANGVAVSISEQQLNAILRYYENPSLEGLFLYSDVTKAAPICLQMTNPDQLARAIKSMGEAVVARKLSPGCGDICIATAQAVTYLEPKITESTICKILDDLITTTSTLTHQLSKVNILKIITPLIKRLKNPTQKAKFISQLAAILPGTYNISGVFPKVVFFNMLREILPEQTVPNQNILLDSLVTFINQLSMHGITRQDDAFDFDNFTYQTCANDFISQTQHIAPLLSSANALKLLTALTNKLKQGVVTIDAVRKSLANLINRIDEKEIPKLMCAQLEELKDTNCNRLITLNLISILATRLESEAQALALAEFFNLDVIQHDALTLDSQDENLLKLDIIYTIAVLTNSNDLANKILNARIEMFTANQIGSEAYIQSFLNIVPKLNSKQAKEILKLALGKLRDENGWIGELSSLFIMELFKHDKLSDALVAFTAKTIVEKFISGPHTETHILNALPLLTTKLNSTNLNTHIQTLLDILDKNINDQNASIILPNISTTLLTIVNKDFTKCDVSERLIDAVMRALTFTSAPAQKLALRTISHILPTLNDQEFTALSLRLLDDIGRIGNNNSSINDFNALRHALGILMQSLTSREGHNKTIKEKINETINQLITEASNNRTSNNFYLLKELLIPLYPILDGTCHTGIFNLTKEKYHQSLQDFNVFNIHHDLISCFPEQQLNEIIELGARKLDMHHGNNQNISVVDAQQFLPFISSHSAKINNVNISAIVRALLIEIGSNNLQVRQVALNLACMLLITGKITNISEFMQNLQAKYPPEVPNYEVTLLQIFAENSLNIEKAKQLASEQFIDVTTPVAASSALEPKPACTEEASILRRGPM